MLATEGDRVLALRCCHEEGTKLHEEILSANHCLSKPVPETDPHFTSFADQ
jgi:hypothetical protein